MARALTTALAAAAKNSNQVCSQVDILLNDLVVLSTDNATMRIDSGEVSWDRSRDNPGQTTLSILIDAATQSLIPATLFSPLSPLSETTVQVRAGFVLGGVPTMVVLGQFDIEELEINEQGGGVRMSITAYDKTRRIARQGFTDIYTVAAGTNIATVLANLVYRTYPNDTVITPATTYTVPALTYEVSDNPLKAIYDLAASVGWEFLYDSVGNAVFSVIANPTGSPAFALTEDLAAADTALLSTNRRLSAAKVYNGVVARGESMSTSTTPVSASVWDTDPTSPTYYDPANPTASVYGPAPYFYVSELITTTQQATDAATAMLVKIKGLAEQNSVVCRFHPGIELDDLVAIQRAKTGISGTHIVDAIAFNLRASSVTLTARERKAT